MYDKVAIYSPYDYIIGGGESYLSNIISFFIANGAKEVIFFNHTPDAIYEKTINYFFSTDERRIIFKKETRSILNYINKGYFDYFIHMSNSKESEFNFRLGKKQIFHCQFPFDLHLAWKTADAMKKNYDAVLVNSEFTLEHYKKCSATMFPPERIHVLYPCCNKSIIDKSIIDKSIINNKTIFVTIGRIFAYHKMANNKHHDRIIRIFNELNKKYANYELHIIGTVQSNDWNTYLKSIAHGNGNIYIHPDAKDSDKQHILGKAHYIIHAAGMDENEMINPFVFEHFGITLIEGLETKCIPICTNGGFPKYYIKHEENGYLFKDGNDLYNIVDKILGGNTSLDVDKAIETNKKIAERFNYKNYTSTLAFLLLIL